LRPLNRGTPGKCPTLPTLATPLALLAENDIMTVPGHKVNNTDQNPD